VEDYRESIRRFHEQGIAVMGAIVLGFDHDTPGCFDATLRFLREVNLDALQLTILTPLPGTPLFARLDREGRVIDRNWEHYDLGHVVFRPLRLLPGELRRGHARVLRTFYSWRWIVRRWWHQLRYLGWREMGLSLALGTAYRLKLSRTGVFANATVE
jgi:radical SAM superfamily enzyme YgiQ (UPF0313 family)